MRKSKYLISRIMLLVLLCNMLVPIISNINVSAANRDSYVDNSSLNDDYCSVIEYGNLNNITNVTTLDTECARLMDESLSDVSNINSLYTTNQLVSSTGMQWGCSYSSALDIKKGCIDDCSNTIIGTYSVALFGTLDQWQYSCQEDGKNIIAAFNVVYDDVNDNMKYIGTSYYNSIWKEAISGTWDLVDGRENYYQEGLICSYIFLYYDSSNNKFTYYIISLCLCNRTIRNNDNSLNYNRIIVQKVTSDYLCNMNVQVPPTLRYNCIGDNDYKRGEISRINYYDQDIQQFVPGTSDVVENCEYANLIHFNVNDFLEYTGNDGIYNLSDVVACKFGNKLSDYVAGNIDDDYVNNISKFMSVYDIHRHDNSGNCSLIDITTTPDFVNNSMENHMRNMIIEIPVRNCFISIAYGITGYNDLVFYEEGTLGYNTYFQHSNDVDLSRINEFSPNVLGFVIHFNTEGLDSGDITKLFDNSEYASQMQSFSSCYKYNNNKIEVNYQFSNSSNGHIQAAILLQLSNLCSHYDRLSDLESDSINMFNSGNRNVVKNAIWIFLKAIESNMSDIDLERMTELDLSGVTNIDDVSYYNLMSIILQNSLYNNISNCKINYNNKMWICQFSPDGSETYGSSDDAYYLDGIWNQLNDYQKDILSYNYKNAVETSNISSTWILNKVYSYHTLYYSGNKDVSDININFDSIQRTVRNRTQDLINTFSPFNIARNCNVLGQYIIGISTYAQSTKDSNLVDEEHGPGNIYYLYDDLLQSFMGTTYTDYKNQEWFPVTLPSYIRLLSSDLNPKETNLVRVLSAGRSETSSGNNMNNLEIFYHFLFNVTYAFEVAEFSEHGEANNYTFEQISYVLGNYADTVPGEPDEGMPEAILEEFKSGLSGVNLNGSGIDGVRDLTSEFSWFNETEVNNSTYAQRLDPTTGLNEVSINMLRSIIELHDLCDFLGIREDILSGDCEWTSAIRGYLMLYEAWPNFFEGLRSNPYIYSQAATGASTIEEPLGIFFNVSESTMTDQWCKGFAMSSLYVPMETNLYDAESIAFLNDSSFISDFYYKFAFYRKALYINTDNSAIVNSVVSNQQSGTRVATLNDLLNYDRDIILTVDDNFYNARDINDVIDKIDYTAIRNGSNLESEERTFWDGLMNIVSELLELQPDLILKTGENVWYSQNLAVHSTKLGYEPDFISSLFDVYLLSESDLIGADNVFNDYEYSVKIPYGVVSAIYRSENLYNQVLRGIATDNAVFKSSRSICMTPGTTSSDWRMLYNYIMLANLSEQIKNDASSTLDLNAPIFIDIFGNIVTESGLVIIPAAANATICGKNWNPYTVGWSEYYNNGYHITTGEFPDEVYSWLVGYTYNSRKPVYQSYEVVDENNVTTIENRVIGTIEYVDLQSNSSPNHDNAGGFFTIDASGDLVLRTTSLDSASEHAIIQWENLNKNSNVIKDLFYSDAYYSKASSGGIYSPVLVNMIVEVLRGAPIEYIDYTYEGLAGYQDISKFGVYMAYKLEELTDALILSVNGEKTGGNSVVTMPNLAFVDGIEYIVLYAFKIMFALMSVGLVVSLYVDSTRNRLGIKSVGKFIYTCVMTVLAVTLIPNVMSWSYYQANKSLLEDEVGYVMMLNYVKSFDGSEIGITNVRTPETTTKLYLKLDDLDINWWDAMYEVLFTNTSHTVSELYRNQLHDNAMALQENVDLKADGLYMDVQDIFDSTTIEYRPMDNSLRNIAYSQVHVNDRDTIVSFVVPYYVILDKLVANINEYNENKDIEAYSWTVGANGHVMTYDIIGPYLTSAEFMDDGFDILGLNEALQTGMNNMSYTSGLFSSTDLDNMTRSRWYPNDALTDQQKSDMIDELYEYAREYIEQNRNLIGKVPDEVFLKVMCLQLSIKYNQIFHNTAGNSIEIMNIDTRDLARLMISDRASVYKNYSYGFARFTYEESGGIGVIFAALYLMVLWLSGILKVPLMIIFIGLLVINIILRKLLFQKESRSIEGYLIGCACLVIINYAYSLALKVSMMIAEYNFGIIATMAVAILVQVLYIAGLVLLCVIEVKDWKNSGFNEFATYGTAIKSNFLHTKEVVVDRLMSMVSTSYGDAKGTRRYRSENFDSSSVDAMLERDAEREDKGTYSAI